MKHLKVLVLILLTTFAFQAADAQPHHRKKHRKKRHHVVVRHRPHR